MKKIFPLFALLLIQSLLIAQSGSENYIVKRQYYKPYAGGAASLPITDISKSRSLVVYYDGLGREIQQVAIKQSPSEKDLVQAKWYDLFGRTDTSFLPYSDGSDITKLRYNWREDLDVFYQNATKVAHTHFPYGATQFDNSPLNRVIEQSAPGYWWRMESGNTREFGYGVNTFNDAILVLEVVDQSQGELPMAIYASGVYNTGDLSVVTSFDEDNNASREFKDKLGRVVCKENVIDDQTGGTRAYTYYVYNSMGQLAFVVPPEGAEILMSATIPNTFAEEDLLPFVFAYVYDGRGRMVEKFIPGKEPEYMVYNDLDRVVLTQDGNSRQNDNWIFSKYDVLGRIVMTGVYHDDSHTTRNSMQSFISGSQVFYEKKTTSGLHNYSNLSYPVIDLSNGQDEVWTVTYYDDYDFNEDGNDDVSFNSTIAEYDIVLTNRTRGMQTGSLVLNPVLEELMLTANFYDYKGNLVQSISDDPFHESGKYIITSEFDFEGKITRSSEFYSSDFGVDPGMHIQKRMVYDHAGRLLKLYHKLNDQDEILMSSHNYNEIGELIEKNIHSVDRGELFWQSIDYSYNIRGWLTKINNSDLDNDGEFSGEEPDMMAESVQQFLVDSISLTVAYLQDSSELAAELEYESKLALEESLDTTNQRLVESDESRTKIVEEDSEEVNSEFARLETLEGQEFVFNLSNLVIDESMGTQDVLNQAVSSISQQLYSEGISDTVLLQELSGLVGEYLLEQVGMVYFNDDDNDLFGMEIKYQEGLYPLGQTYGLYNGNISGIEWRTAGNNNEKRGYGFKYDGLNRLTQASYGVHSGTSWSLDIDRYTLSGINYDKNGNIESLIRNGLTDYDPQVFGALDNLSYFYKGNLLVGVNDQVADHGDLPDFDDNGYDDNIDPSEPESWEYQYDANGNMTKDFNKGVSIAYNEFNLPIQVVFSRFGTWDPEANKIHYEYDASGRKLRKLVYEQGALIKTVDYLGSFQWEDEDLAIIHTDEGRMVQTGEIWSYEYYLKDHLGSPRVVIQASEIEGEAQIAQIDHYYPFGMRLGGLSESYTLSNEYLFNGKERQGEFGLEWIDYGARMYDPSIARWYCVDKLAEQYISTNPYHFSGSNPVNNIEIDGNSYFSSAFARNSGAEANRPSYDFNKYGEPPTGDDNTSDDNDEKSESASNDNADGDGKEKAKGESESEGDQSNASSGGDGEYAALGAIALGAVAVDGPLPFGDAVALGIGTYILADKMASEISRIAEKVNNTRGFVYELRVNRPGTYVNVRGVPVQMNAGDVWKYGETTKGFGRYSQSTLDNMIPGGVSMVPIFQGNVVEIKIQEKIMIYGYSMMNGHLPPGNKIYR